VENSFDLFFSNAILDGKKKKNDTLNEEMKKRTNDEGRKITSSDSKYDTAKLTVPKGVNIG